MIKSYSPKVDTVHVFSAHFPFVLNADIYKINCKSFIVKQRFSQTIAYHSLIPVHCKIKFTDTM